MAQKKRSYRAEDDMPTWTRRRLPGGWQTKKHGKMHGTVRFASTAKPKRLPPWNVYKDLPAWRQARLVPPTERWAMGNKRYYQELRKYRRDR